MNYSQLSAYLQAYLQSNDPNVIDNIPNFMSLAASRMKSDLRNSLIERSITLLTAEAQGIPPGFVASRLITINDVPQEWRTVKSLAEGAIGFSIAAQNIVFNPAPAGTDVIQMVYYVINQDNEMADTVPHIMLHAAATEAELFQGDTTSAANEQTIYQRDIDASNGWDFQGSIGLGQGNLSTAVSTGTSSGGGGTVPAPVYPSLDQLTDVTISAPTNLQVLLYDAATAQWENGTAPGGGGGGGMDPSDALPKMDGLAAAGVSALASRGDHVHPSDTSRALATDMSQAQSDISANTIAINTHISNATGAHAASAISNVPSGSIAATTVQAALNELDTEKAVVGNTLPLADGTASAGVSALASRIDHVHPSSGGGAAPAGTLIDFAGATAPAGYLACPKVATNISRTTYAALFAAIGTLWGAGDGSTTFGMPYFPAYFAAIQGSGDVGTMGTGVVQAHTHTYTYANAAGAGGGMVNSNGASGAFNPTATQNPTSANNFAAGMRVLKCVKY